MKNYEIQLCEATSDFFQEIAYIVQRPIEEILSNALFKQAEIISRKILNATVIDDENMS